MNKAEWTKLLESQIELLRKKAVEIGQDRMIDLFYSEEKERLDLFNNSEDVGHKHELEELFNIFQGYYLYENNVSFSKMAMFENE
ncbi:MAG: hypothetical protein GY829_06945 [Gammaproteobacteria bacterium]|nr:hypothetical protein [Gammaproteobacteria bacterium]